MKIERYAGVTHGKMDIEEIFREDLKHFEGKRFRYILTNEKKRTSEQNKYWWAVVVKTIADWLRSHGNDVTDNDVHEFIKMHSPCYQPYQLKVLVYYKPVLR